MTYGGCCSCSTILFLGFGIAIFLTLTGEPKTPKKVSTNEPSQGPDTSEADFTRSGSTDLMQNSGSDSSVRDRVDVEEPIQIEISSPQILGISVLTLSQKFALEAKGFVQDKKDDPSKSPWIFRRSDNSGEYNLTIYGRAPDDIYAIQAMITRFDDVDIEPLAKTFFSSIASLGSESLLGQQAEIWVAEKTGTISEIKIGNLKFQLFANAPKARVLRISSED